MKRMFSKFYLGTVLLFLYLPIIVMIVFSFNSTKSRSVFTGFSTEWYQKLFQNELVMKSFMISIAIAIMSAIIATLIGTFAAIGIYRMKKVSRSIIMNINYLPIINPDIVTGVAFMLLFVFIGTVSGIPNMFGFWTILIAHITFNIPYIILNVLPKLRQLDKSQYEAAMDLGCNEKQAFQKVILPQIMPGIITGFLMALAYSIDDFVISYFTSGPSAQTLPVTINSMIRRIVTPEVYALSTIMFFMILILLIVYNVFDAKKYKKKEVH